MLPTSLIVVASTIFLMAIGLASRARAATESVPAAGTVDWAISLDAARTAAEEKVASAEDLTTRFDHLISLFAGCPSCREYYHRSLSYRLDSEFHDDRAAIVRALVGQYADDPVGLSRMYLWARRFEDATRVATVGLETVPFMEQRTELRQILADAHNGGTNPVGVEAPARTTPSSCARWTGRPP